MKNIIAIFCLMLSTLTVYAGSMEDTEDTTTQCTIQLSQSIENDINAHKLGLTPGETSVLEHTNNEKLQVAIKGLCQDMKESDYSEDNNGQGGVAPLLIENLKTFIKNQK